MQSDKSPMKQLNNRSRSVWLTAALLAVLVVISVSIVGSCLYSYSHRSDCVISLYDGDVTEVEKQAVQKTASIQPQTSPVVQSRASQYKGSQARQQADQYAFEVADAEQIWRTDTSVDLFKTSYANDKGAITVDSANGDNVVAPGTSGQYTFTLKNTGSKAADYKVWVETELNTLVSNLPLEIRMSNNDGWLLGSRDSWEKASDLDGVSLTERVAAGKSADYTFYWQWPYERGDDEADTLLGNAGEWMSGGQQLDYKVTIHTLATESANQADSGNSKWNQLLKPAKTGDTAAIALWCVVLAGSACVIGWFILLKKKKKEER